MACFGGGGGSKAASNVTTDPKIASQPFLEVKLTLGNANTRETVLVMNTAGEYLPGQVNQSQLSSNRPPR